jgi:c(7)-type cytochrome triheme protein
MAGCRQRVHKGKAVLGVAGLLLLAAGSHDKEQQPQQPIPYSHKTHLALGLKCSQCHENADPGAFMGFPDEGFCMGCHRAEKADSPYIQKLAAAFHEKKPIPWVRVYKIPTDIYFSHRVHTAAGVKCETCHGPVRQRTVITREVVHNMKSCMACHAATKARNDCTACHEERG